MDGGALTIATAKLVGRQNGRLVRRGHVHILDHLHALLRLGFEGERWLQRKIFKSREHSERLGNRPVVTSILKSPIPFDEIGGPRNTEMTQAIRLDRQPYVAQSHGARGT